MSAPDNKKIALKTAANAASAYIAVMLGSGKTPELQAMRAIATLVRVVEVLASETESKDFRRDVMRAATDYKGPNEYLAITIGEQYPEEFAKVAAAMRGAR